MKKSWKTWLGALAACALSFQNGWAQAPESYSGSVGISSTGSGDVGTVRLGGPASPGPIQRTQGFMSPEAVFDDAPPMIEDAFTPSGYGSDGSVGYANTQPLDSVIWSVGRTNLDRLGMNGGFTNINAFIPLSIEGSNSMWFMIPQANINDNARGGANILLGRGFYSAGEDRLYRAAGVWSLDAMNRGTYNAFGGSFESLGQFFSLRSNFLLPVGAQFHEYDSRLVNGTINGTNLQFTRLYNQESTYQYYDIEAAVPMPILGRYGFDIGVGGYYLVSKHDENSPGFSLRLQSQVTEDFWIQGLLTTDDVFESRFSLNMELTLPDGMPSRWFRRKPVSHMLTSSFQRYGRIPVSFRQKSEIVTAMGGGGGGGGGGAIDIAVIDPNRTTAGGTGSAQDPFMSLAEYMSLSAAQRSAFEIVFVKARDQGNSPTLDDTNLNTTITLLDYQVLIGDGLLANGQAPMIQTANLGMVALPVGTGPLPVLTNSAALGSPVVTLANHNEVTGLRINGTQTGIGIFGNNIDSFNIHDVTINEVTAGIQITSNTTPVLGVASENYGILQNNTIINPTTPTRVASTAGISITHTAGDLDLLVTGNTVRGFLGEDANQNGMIDMAPVMEDTNGNSVLDPGVGISILATGGTITADDSGFDPLLMTGRRTGIISNTTTGNGTGLQLVASNAGTEFDMLVMNNTSTGNGTGLRITSNTGATATADVIGNTITGNTDLNTGFVALADAATLNLLTVTQNTFSNNAGDGVRLVAANGGTLNLPRPEDANADGLLTPGEDLNNNGIRDPGEDVNGNGVLDPPEDLNMNGRLDLGFSGNTVENNGRNGVVILADNAVFNAPIGAAGPVGTPRQGNIIRNNGGVTQVANQTVIDGSGILVTTANNGVVNTNIQGNDITLNELSGIKIAPNNGIVNVQSIFRNNLNNNVGDGVMFSPTNGGSFTLNNFTLNNTQANGGAIMNIGGTGGTINLGVIENNVFDRRVDGTAGILFNAVNANIVGVFRNNTFLGSAANQDLTFGIGGTIQGGSIDLLIENNYFDGNADAAIGIILGVSDNRTGTGTGTPVAGDGADGNIRILNNVIVGTRLGNDPRFDGAGISLQLEGQEADILNGQNDINGDGIPDAPPIPLPNGGDITTILHPAPTLTGVIAGNLIGTLNGSEDFNGNGILDLGEDLNGDGIISPLNGNAGSGIDLRASGDAYIYNFLIGSGPGGFTRNIIANNGDPVANANNLTNGDGIRIRRRDNAIIDNFTINGNIIQNNLNDGIDIAGENNGIPFGPAEILNFTVTNNQLLNNGFRSAGTLSNGTAAAGRQGVAGRGIQLRADAGTVLEVNIADNIISGNRMSGIEARTFTDTHDYIGGGRDVSVSVNGGDDGVIFGVWERNNITNNGFLSNEDRNRNGILDAGEDANGNGVLDLAVEGHGIALGRVDFIDPDNPGGITEGFNNGGLRIPDRDGDGIPDLPVLTIQNNIINNNAEDGLHIFLDKSPIFVVTAGENRTSRVNVLNNDIVGNGDDGIDINNTFDSFFRGNFDNNLITNNGLYSGQFQVTQAGGNVVSFIGDGIQIFTSDAAFSTLSFDQNRIKDNNGRGVNVLTSDNGYLIADFDRNTISSNKREGFYLVNAPLGSTINAIANFPAGIPQTGYTGNTWLPDFDSNHELFTYGRPITGPSLLGPAGNTTPAIIAPFTQNPITSPFRFAAPVSDIVLTSNIIDNNGSVVPDSDGEDPYSTLGGLVIRVGTASDVDTSIPSVPIPGFTGGVRARVEDNRMSGNYGRDVMFDGFVATEPPSVDGLPDPLVRFDLQFRNNRGGSIDVSGNNFNVFYNNTAPNLRGGNNIKRPNPPFGNAAVLRDATVNLGLGPDGNLYPGFGVPTLRIEQDGSAPDAFGNFIGNNSFNLIYSDFNPIYWLSVPIGSLVDPVVVPGVNEQGLFQ